MRAFITRFLLFALAPLAAVIAALLSADGRTDAFYLRLTTPKASSLVLGTSRAAQGIRPAVLDSALNAAAWGTRTFNYGFAKGLSNYGPSYLASVMRKLDRSGNDGAFVLAVDPWSLGMSPGDGDGTGWAEDAEFLSRIRCVSCRPNLEYLFGEYSSPILTILFPSNQQRSDMVVRDDGWLEVRISMDSAEVHRREREKRIEYGEAARTMRLSPYRVACLNDFIDSLAPYGTVLLVRLPVQEEMLAIEHGAIPHFDAVMERTARSKGIRYLNRSADDRLWNYTDGHHLTADDARPVTMAIAQALLEARQQPAAP